MKKLKMQALALGGAEVLSRGQMKHVMGGDFPVTNCAADCTGNCVHQSGACKGKSGTCSSTQAGTCLCTGVCE